MTGKHACVPILIGVAAVLGLTLILGLGYLGLVAIDRLAVWLPLTPPDGKGQYTPSQAAERVADRAHCETPTRPATLHAVPEQWAAVLDRIHARESSRGLADTSRPGPAGEMGEYQVTPIFIADVRRITGRAFDPYDPNDTRRAIIAWLTHYLGPAGHADPARCYRAYRYGPSAIADHD